MIRPDMAAMLGYVATDCGITEPLLRQLVQAADESFNCITVDGDTSTNDSFILISTEIWRNFFPIQQLPVTPN